MTYKFRNLVVIWVVCLAPHTNTMMGHKEYDRPPVATEHQVNEQNATDRRHFI